LRKAISTDFIEPSIFVARERGYLVFLGLDTEGVQRHAVHVDGVYEDLILMAVLF